MEWRYGIRWNGLWLAANGSWQRDGSHPAVQWWPTMQQAKDWRERHMPGVLDAWGQAIGLFRDGRDVTAAFQRGEV